MDRLERHLPTGYIGKEEMDEKAVVRSSWRKLVDYAETVQDGLSAVQGEFKKKLVNNIKAFQKEVVLFREHYKENGPMTPNIAPKEAVVRLKRFQDEYEMRHRKYDIYRSGEELFAMKLTEYPDLVQTGRGESMDLGLRATLAVRSTRSLTPRHPTHPSNHQPHRAQTSPPTLRTLHGGRGEDG